MSKNLGEVINDIMEENASNRVLILTDRLHIIGTVHEYRDKCEECHNCLLSLKNVKIARIEDLCHCSIDNCECDLESFVEYKWFNICTNSIVGFSILGRSN